MVRLRRIYGVTEESNREVGTLPLSMVIADETDEAAQSKWAEYHDNADVKALGVDGSPVLVRPDLR